MNTEILEQSIRIMTEKLAKAELQNAFLEAEIIILKEEQHDAKTNNEG